MTLSDKAGNHTLTAADGHSFDCWMQPATAAHRGGLIILQEIFGVTDQLKGVARHYAAQGFNVAIPALFDRKQRNAVIPFSEASKGRDIMLSLDKAETMTDITATIEAMSRENDKLTVIGFCWGGGLALRVSQEFALAGCIAFYGTRLTANLDKPLKAPMLFHFAATDEHSPPEVIAQIRTTYPQAETYIYEAGHAFANDARDVYVKDAAILAHKRTEEFLNKVLG